MEEAAFAEVTVAFSAWHHRCSTFSRYPTCLVHLASLQEPSHAA
jgi:hypothetical protein